MARQDLVLDEDSTPLTGTNCVEYRGVAFDNHKVSGQYVEARRTFREIRCPRLREGSFPSSLWPEGQRG